MYIFQPAFYAVLDLRGLTLETYPMGKNKSN